MLHGAKVSSYIVRWLLDNIVTERFTVDNHSGILKATEAAASDGHLHILEEALEHAGSDHLEAVQWFFNNDQIALPMGGSRCEQWALKRSEVVSRAPP
ncbi:hypothetical protein KRP22_003381 [Phytophthora ramorum]|nr:hypothetical protein KRP22_9311 [Phytophthora ramorum]